MSATSATDVHAHRRPLLIDDQRVDRWGLFCQLYVLALAVIAVAVASRSRASLHERFTFDGKYIEDLLQFSDSSLNRDDPFRNIALVYRFLGLSSAPNLAAMLALAVFGVAVFAALRWGELARLTPVGLAVITACYVLAVVYLAQYSKEFVSLVLVAVLLILPRGRWPELLLVGGMIAYAVTIRPYWGIVVALYVAARFVLPRIKGIIPVLLLVALTYVALQLAFNGVLGESLSYPRVSVNDTRAGVNIAVGSLIVDFLPDAVGLQWLNAFLVFCSLVLPWPLLLGSSVTYLVMGLLLAYLWGLLFWSIRRVGLEGSARRRHWVTPSGHSPPIDRSPRPERAVALLLCLVVVQAVFEPDYGSYVKHLAPVLPLFIALLPLRPLVPWSGTVELPAPHNSIPASGGVR